MMATLKIDNVWKEDIRCGVSNISEEIKDRIVIESNDLKKYVRKQMGISRWKKRR